MAVILNFCPTQIARDRRIVRETAKKLGQVIIFPGVRIERHGEKSASAKNDALNVDNLCGDKD